MIVRLASPSDAPGVQAIYAPYVRDTSVSFETEPPTVADVAERIAAAGARYPWLVADDGGAVAGYAYAGPHRGRAAYQWSAEVSAYVDPTYHRRGIARALYQALFDVLREQGFATALAGITLPNVPSVGFHEALGFRRIATYPAVGFKHGAWHDTAWWTLRLGDGAAPEPPRSLGAVARAVADSLTKASARIRIV